MFTYKIDDNLELRQLTYNQSDKIFQLVDSNRDHLREWLPWVDATKTEEDTKEFIKTCLQHQLDNNWLQASIWYQGKFAGMVGTHEISWKNKKTTIGYWLGEEFIGKGIVTKACGAIIDYIFNDLELNRVAIYAATNNKASRAVPMRLGFSHDGIERDAEWLYNHFVDYEVYSVLKKEWALR